MRCCAQAKCHRWWAMMAEAASAQESCFSEYPVSKYGRKNGMQSITVILHSQFE